MAIDVQKAVQDGVKEGMRKAFEEQAAQQEHEALVMFHKKSTGQDKAENPMNAVLANQQTLIDLFQKFNENSGASSGGSASSDSQIASGSTGFAASATASSQNSVEASSGRDDGFLAGSNSIKNVIINHGIVVADAGGISQVSSSIGSANPTSEGEEPVQRKLGTGAVVDASTASSDRERSQQIAEEGRVYQEYTMKPTMSKLSEALDKYLDEKNNPPVAETGGMGFSGLLGTILGGSLGILGGLATGWLSGLKTQWSSIGKAFKDAHVSAKNLFNKTKIGKKVNEVVTSFKNGVNNIKSAVTKKFTSMVNSVKSSIGSLKTSFMNTIKGWKESVKNSAVGKAASAIKDKVGSIFGKAKSFFGGAKKAASEGKILSFLGDKLKSGMKAAGKIAKNAIDNSPTIKLIKAAGKAAKTAGKIAMSVGKRIPVIQGVGALIDGAKNTYDVWKKTGNIKDTMSTALAGATDAVLNTLAVPELVSTAKGLYKGYKEGGFKGALKGAGSGLLNAHDANQVSYGQTFAAEVAHWSGNETATTEAIRKANMYGLTKDQVGLANINGNAGGFGTAAAIYQGDKKLASGSTVNSNQPNATTGENTTAKRKSEDDKAKDTAEIIKQGFIEAMTSEEVRKVQAEQSKMTGDAINDKLMG